MNKTSKAQKASIKKYQSTEERKAARKAAIKKYQSLEKGKINMKAAIKKYQSSEKGKAARKAANLKTIADIKRVRYESIESFLKILVGMKKSLGKTKKSKHNFIATYDEVINILEKQDRKCFYSGLPFVIENRHPMSPSIDRIDSLKGYTIDNIVICSYALNKMKSNSNFKDLIYIFEAVLKHAKA